MPLALHLLIHFVLALAAGYFIGWKFKQVSFGLMAGFLGGFLIDLDHVLEYILVFGWHFNLSHFLNGWEFLASDKIHIWFHAWEYVPFLIILALFVKKYKAAQTFFLALALGISVHLVSDSLINQYPPQYYSLLHRQSVNFATEKLLSPAELEKNRELRREQGI